MYFDEHREEEKNTRIIQRTEHEKKKPNYHLCSEHKKKEPKISKETKTKSRYKNITGTEDPKRQEIQ